MQQDNEIMCKGKTAARDTGKKIDKVGTPQ
jgi:hypothetical protein